MSSGDARTVAELMRQKHMRIARADAACGFESEHPMCFVCEDYESVCECRICPECGDRQRASAPPHGCPEVA